tara:strand:- start:166 stop:558 length:393 start_codon:yes stop_codon:yes gene_type:complete
MLADAIGHPVPENLPGDSGGVLAIGRLKQFGDVSAGAEHLREGGFVVVVCPGQVELTAFFPAEAVGEQAVVDLAEPFDLFRVVIASSDRKPFCSNSASWFSVRFVIWGLDPDLYLPEWAIPNSCEYGSGC